MTTVVPESELLRKAVAYIAERRQDEPDKPIAALVEEACVRFNLSPKEAEYLTRLAGRQDG